MNVFISAQSVNIEELFIPEERIGFYGENDIFRVVQDIWAKADNKDMAKMSAKIAAL
ncbi:hypothetical protein Barb6_02348 [Bacteroidales bacterium Barb6]|nr:hypothetical protein Barb6_02348 [Bacteroidales bacterium Barb6]